MSEFTEKRLDQELKKMSDEELITCIHQAKEEAMKLGNSEADEKEWKLIRDTVLAIGAELDRRKQ